MRKTPARLNRSECATAIRRKLLAWYDRDHRPLPWRATQDPYRIWISEVMLQQTRAQAVIPYYGEFLRRFPTVKALAAADEQSLLACWSGLGYYSRARNLQKAARLIVRDHEGAFPRTLDDALALPGVGEYTAAAVLSIAYGVPLPVLDGNVARVVSRLFALKADVRATAGKRILLEQAGAILSRRRPGDFNQAMMELGATVCLPQQPRCTECPLRGNCRALAKGQVDQYPPVRLKAKPSQRRFVAALILDANGRCLLVRRPPEAQWMPGFWELPMREANGPNPATRTVRNFSEEGILLGPLAGSVRHTITTSNLDVSVYLASITRAAIPPEERWVSPGAFDGLPLTTITRKALRLHRAYDKLHLALI